jgi:hypothetical protein
LSTTSLGRQEWLAVILDDFRFLFYSPEAAL